VVKVVLKRWQSCGIHGQHGAWAYSRGLRVEPPVGSGAKPLVRGSGAKPPRLAAF